MKTENIEEGRDKKHITNIRLFSGVSLVVICFVLLFAGVGMVSATAPSITNWSSSGGNTTNKDNPQDLMYLVLPGDEITFSVTTSEPCTFNWSVNKIDQGINSNTFTFTVPSLNCSQDLSECIFEVHVKAYNDNGEAHHEWVISTLSEEEAPDFFDSFTDKRYWNRTDKDPWGRSLPEWGETICNNYIIDTPVGIYDSSKGYLEKKPKEPDESDYCYAGKKIFANSTTTYGTWIIRYQGSLDYYFIHPGEDELDRIYSTYGNYHYSHAGTGWYIGHLWIEGRHRVAYYNESYGESAKRYSLAYKRGINEYGSYLSYIPGWVELKIIRTPEGAFYVYVNDKLTLDSFNIDNTYNISKYIWTSSKIIDGVEIYNERYLFPEKNAEYKEYGKDEVKKGIVINGRDVRLNDIANFIKNNSLFTYDSNTRTAISYTNLVLENGAELVIENETLKIHSDYDGEHEIRIKQGATFKLLNSRVTSTNEHYYLWKFTSPFEREYMPQGGFSQGYARARCIFIAKNSIINNSGFMYLDSPRGLILENTQLTNLVEVNSGKSGVRSDNSQVSPLNASFWFRENMVTVPYRSFKNLSITGRNGKSVKVVFEGGDPFGKLNIYDSNFENVTVEARSHPRFRGTTPKYEWEITEPDGSKNYYYGLPNVPRTLNLINCKFKDIKTSNKFSYIRPKYYLDVKVVDNNGNPIPGAKVKVVNEVDNVYHPPENIEDAWNWTNTYYEGYGYHLVPFKKWTSVDDYVKAIRKPALSEVSTKGDGHTPLPSDKKNTLVVTGYTLSNETNADIIRVRLLVHTGEWYMNIYVADDEKGEILYYKKTFGDYNLIAPGTKLHAHLIYSKENNSVHLKVEDQNDTLLWDTGELPLKTQDRQTPLHPDLRFNKVGFGVYNCQNEAGCLNQENISWDGEGIYMYSPPHSQGGYLKTRIDNMKIEVSGKGLIEDNNYSSDPQLITIEENSDKEYNLSQNTEGNSLVWDFDVNVIDHIQKYGAWADVELRGYTENPQKNYTYTIIAEKNGKTASMSGLDIDESWYREDPDKPTKTIVCNIDTGNCRIEGSTTGTLSGKVTDKDTGLPIVGATVTANSHQTTTNSTGDYILSLPAGNYTLTASKPGYQSATSSATVNEGATTTVNFTLTPIPPDTTSPSAVIDLSTSNPTPHSITLTWTAPGDDGNNGTASQYDIRYSTSEITEENWNSATQCTGVPAPKPAGSSETFTVTGLSPNTTYYFALKTADEVPNWSPISNSPSGKTAQVAGGLVGYWKFDEGSGTTAVDSSGNNNNGTLIDNPDWVDGKIGKALEFNGSTNYVEINDSDSLDGFDAITIEAWVKPILGQRGAVVSRYLYDYNIPINERVYELTVEQGGTIGFALSSDGSSATWLESSNTLQDNEWNHIAAVSDGNTMRIYINGEQDPNTKAAPASLHSSSYNLQIGAWEYSPNQRDTYFNGVIDEVKIYNRALSAEEIKADYEAGTPPASISDLQNTTGTTWINWTWTNPSDNDFAYTMVYLDGVFKTNTSNPYYNATGLVANTTYEIGTHTVDVNGNVNTTWVNQTVKTLAVPNNPPYKPGNPSPADGAVNIPIDIDLSWSGGDPDAGDTVTYDVYFGTDSNPPMVSNDQLETTYDPGTLDYSTLYYWRIVAKDEHGASNESEVWCFTTASDHTNSTLVQVSPVAQTVLKGQNFHVNISVSPDTAIAGMQLDLLFNSTLVEVNSVTEGDLFKQDGASTHFNPGTIDNATGIVTYVYGAIIKQGANVSTPGTFAIVNLTASNTLSGTSPLALANVKVSDPDAQAVPINVTNGTVTIKENEAPVLSTIGDKSVDEGSLLEFTISAYDPDGDTLTYSASNLPSGASFDASSRTFSWTPTYDQAGTYTNVHFEVSDGYLTDSEDITITVNNTIPRWDVNEDGVVDIFDLVEVGQHFNESFASPPYPRYDVNQDGVVDIGDVTLVGQHFGEVET